MPQPPRGYEDRQTPRGPRLVALGKSGGFATIASGSASVEVANTYVRSGQLITPFPAPASFGAIASNQGGICVRSINPGVGFVLGTYTGVAYPWDTVVHWLIHDTN